MKIFSLTLAFLLFTLFGSGPALAAEPDVHGEVQRLQEEWAAIFYQQPEDQHAARFKELLGKIHTLSERYPQSAEALALEGVVLCTYAGSDIGFSVLRKVKQARELFEKSITLDPRALDGTAYVALGNLYHRLPGWPISFGNDNAARQYFTAAQKMFPDAIDTNYFYGDFLLSEGEFEQALYYLEKADKAVIRSETQISDLQLKTEVAEALADARARNDDRSDFFTRLIPSFGGDSSSP